MQAKDVLRVTRSRLIRLWINNETHKGKKPVWIETGHYYSGFEFKLARIKEADGLKRNRLCGYEATGTFEPAQNTIADYAQHLFLMNGARGVAMLFGDKNFPDRGKMLILDWNGDSDQRISIVAEPQYAGNALKASGELSGFLSGFRLYEVSGLTFANGTISYTKLTSLFNEASGHAEDFGNNIGI